MKAVRMLEYHKPLVFEDIAISAIQADEVPVKVAAHDVCRSDILPVDSVFQTYADILPPVIAGHDIAGTFRKVGTLASKMARLMEFDHAVVSPGWGTAYAAAARSATHLNVGQRSETQLYQRRES